MGLVRAASLETSALVDSINDLVVLLCVSRHVTLLVSRCRKVERESASGEVRRHFRAEVCSAANASHMGT